MQAAPSQRRIILISEASNQLLFHSQKFSVEWIWWRIHILLKSCSRSKKLQPGGKPNSFTFRNPGRPRRSINCSRDGSRTASRFAIQVNRDGRSNCSQLGSRPSPANKPCPRRGDSRRSSGQTRRRSAPDGCRKGRWETWSCWQCGCFHPQLSWYSSSALIVPVGLFGWWDAAQRFLPVYIINFTTGLRVHIHTFMTIFPNAVSHSLLSIIFNTACLHVTYDSSQPTCFMFWSFWGLKSAAFSDFESFVTMSKLLQLLVITLILKCVLVWARYADVPNHYHAQGIKEMGVGPRHRQLCRPWCLGLMAACTRTWHG